MPTGVRLARVSRLPLSVDAVLGHLREPWVGGISVFLGVVRDHDGGQAVSALDYTAHPSATDRLHACAAAIAEEHQVLVAVDHRVGHLEVGDLAVVVATAAAHRAPALAATAALIDSLKEEVPIWKEQHLTTGSVEWVGL